MNHKPYIYEAFGDTHVVTASDIRHAAAAAWRVHGDDVVAVRAATAEEVAEFDTRADAEMRRIYGDGS